MKKILLKQISIKYAKEIFKEFDEQIAFYMYPKAPKSFEDTLEFICNSIESRKSGLGKDYVIVDTEGEFFGCCGVKNLDTDIPEIGIWIKKSAQGKGYGRLSVKLLIRKVITYKKVVRYIKYSVDRRNRASLNLIKSIGGVEIGNCIKTSQSKRRLDEIEFAVYQTI